MFKKKKKKWVTKFGTRGNLNCAELFYSSDFRIKASLSSPSPCLSSFYDFFFPLHAGSFYLCSHSAEWVPRALLCYAGTEAVRLAVSYSIVKCPSWWKQPGQGDTLLTGPQHTNCTPTSKHTHTQSHINRMPFTLPLSPPMLYWHWDENKSTGAPGGHCAPG